MIPVGIAFPHKYISVIDIHSLVVLYPPLIHLHLLPLHFHNNHNHLRRKEAAALDVATLSSLSFVLLYSTLTSISDISPP